MTENNQFNMGHGFKKIGKAIQDLTNSNNIFNQSLAKVLLSMPIPMNYETWVFLHEIVDGDVE